MEFAMQMKIVKRNARTPRVRFSPAYMTEIETMAVEKAYLLAHKLAHGRKDISIHVPKKYNEVANKYADLVMYTLKLEMAYIKKKTELEKTKQDNSNEELKRWRFIFGLIERHNLNEEVELKYMEE